MKEQLAKNASCSFIASGLHGLFAANMLKLFIVLVNLG